MNLGDISILLLSLGVGGVAGAALAVLAAGSRLGRSWEGFSLTFQNFMAGKSDPESQVLGQAFEELKASLESLMHGVARLRRALRLK